MKQLMMGGESADGDGGGSVCNDSGGGGCSLTQSSYSRNFTANNTKKQPSWLQNILAGKYYSTLLP